MKATYIEHFLSKEDSDFYLEYYKNLPWLTKTEKRSEYFMAHELTEYTYGSGEFARTYTSANFDSETLTLLKKLNDIFDCSYNVCFFNRYDMFNQNLDFHADDSPEMCKEHPICVISLNDPLSEREIYWKHKDFKGPLPSENKILLKHGSLFTMPSFFQEEHLHKIVKSSRQNSKTRISLTFRKYKK